ncbi:MAG: Integral membrane protein MviN [Candidatus Beckwithbacteria bacterium GW2011_GWC2_47_9]|uniref:Probable lipid II flippase MurJ n=2 Tax=Microgenomates group TaxID=1794810 RepID=A0A0G1HH75_9BACT|nr:MAG: Integral membrane protein MviN [Candidatus Gottesmanbacteria bacterium GW2011_GWA2_44_17]KKU87157.1 MAG: Integral membrane protein MviN [Candidatus Beckwithbacteria bacterium GW2011_GWC2_47_9]
MLYLNPRMVNHLFRKQNSVLSAAAILMTAVLVSRLLGLLRDRFLAAYFFDPASAGQLDVYFAAFRLPDMVFQLLVVGALAAAFIPVFSSYFIKDKTEAWHVASTVISLGLVFFLLLAGLIFFLSEPLSRLIAPSFSAQEMVLMVTITRWLLLAQLSFLISNFLTGILQSQQHFIVPALAPIVYNLGIIIGILSLSPIMGIFGPVAGVILGAFLHLVIQLPLVQATGFKFKLSFDWRHPGVRRIGRLMLPRTLALAVSQIELTVAVFIATALPAGSLAIFYFAQHLNSLPVGLFGATIGQAALPALAQTAQDSSLLKFKQLLISSLNQVLYLSMPAGMILLILRLPAVRLAFGARSFPWEATLLTGQAVALFAISVFAQSAIQILVRGFYALSNTRSPFVIGASAVAVNVFLSFIFVYRFGLGILGLALAISLASFLHLGLLFWRLSRILGGFSADEFYLPVAKMTVATLLTGLSLWLPFRLLDKYIFNTTRTLELVGLSAVTVLIGLLVYGALSYLFKIKELNHFFDLIKKVRHFYYDPIVYP